MTDVTRLGEIVMERIRSQVPELGGRVVDKATERTAYPYCVLTAIYGAQADVECIDTDDWTLQFSIFDRDSDKLSMAVLAGKVRAALKGWSDTQDVTMHPIRVGAPRIYDENDGVTVQGVLLVEAVVEGEAV